MGLQRLVLSACLLFLIPALASDPGQPLDCSDWVFLEPGYSCTEWIPFGCASTLGLNGFCTGEGGRDNPPGGNWVGLDAVVLDNAGTQYRWERVELGLSECGLLHRIQILTYDGQTQHVFAHLDERCNGSNAVDLAENFEGFGLQFDDKQGRMLLTAVKSRCTSTDGSCAYTSGRWVPAIEGFATTFEILQTYNPSGQEISFRVPYMPGGFQFADYFDTYYGSLATVGDWSQVRPLQCGYPATPPSAGDYLTVEDTLPTPAAGEGRYYITAASFQGETRYGRKSSGGVLAGRDPAQLPPCQ